MVHKASFWAVCWGVWGVHDGVFATAFTFFRQTDRQSVCDIYRFILKKFWMEREHARKMDRKEAWL